MNARTKSIEEQADRLPAADRIRLVEHLLATLDKPGPDIDRAWADESERRLDAYLQGETTARDEKDVLAKHLNP
jgi:putative addiction module component (TIGR02574 family)